MRGNVLGEEEDADNVLDGTVCHLHWIQCDFEHIHADGYSHWKANLVREVGALAGHRRSHCEWNRDRDLCKFPGMNDSTTQIKEEVFRSNMK